ncbi:uncharacterized protein LOC130358087 isoform X2 [Hyla sarda]|uniref:uncharacterized protein LOC130358087 isoform X2 n=1 Tax=Hyla sarda TaxID=327740 RepID=UPI0024C3445B|nr:uncharacterized protein LOC130358087 isoform X2 [Hyla sarda]
MGFTFWQNFSAEFRMEILNHMTFGHNKSEWTNATDVGTTTVKCLVQQSSKFTNESLGNHQLTLPFGHLIYIFGFIGILIVLKSLLTKIMMVENKPEDSEYIMSMCETAATYKITLQRCTDNNKSPLTPPNSPCMGQPLNTPVTSTPVFFSGTHCCSLSSLNGGSLYYGERCPLSSPEGSTKCLV